MKKLIIIPTHNEAGSIGELIQKILALNEPGLNILVIDDNSSDNTRPIVKKLQKENAGLSMIEREAKFGLGSAYVAGFKHAIAHGYDLVVQMDGDLSHDPLYLKDMLAMMPQYDFVVGSRYINGGGISNWTISRRLVSRFGSLYAKIILGMNIQDFTGGYNLWKTSAIKAIDLDSIRSSGYSFQIEMKYLINKKGYKFIEVPIVFQERTSGLSKMSYNIIFEAAWRLWWLRLGSIFLDKPPK